MAKIMIEIDDKTFGRIFHRDCIGQEYDYEVTRAIVNGTVLPKGCGRLIDAKALEDAMYHEAFEVDSDMQKWDSGNWIRYKMFENTIHNAPTIIEAEKGGRQ